LVIESFNSKTDGTIFSARRYADGLKKRGHTVRIVSTDIEGPDTYNLKLKNIPFVSYMAGKQGQSFMRFDKKIMTQALTGADVVHCYLPWQMAEKTRKLADKMGIACTAAFHVQPDNITYNIGMSKLGFVRECIYKKFRIFYNKIDNIHCPSRFIAQILKKRKYRSKMHVISNGITSNFIPKIKNPQEALIPIEKRDVFNILMVGRLSPEKHQVVLIEAISQSKYRDKIQLYLAGKGPSRAKLEKLGKTLPRKPVIEFLNQDDLVDRIYLSDLYVHTSEVDIEPLSCIEAFTCGKVPILAHSKKSGASLFAITEHSLFPAGDSKALANQIDYWIEHPEERYEYEKKYAEEGRHYKLDYSLEKFENMLREAKQDAAVRQLMKKKEYRNLVKRLNRRPGLLKIFGWLAFYLIAIPVLFLINMVLFGFKIKNKKYLFWTKLKSGSAITICNHIHQMDVTMAGLAIFPFKPIFTSEPANFKSKVGFLVSLFGTVPIPKNPHEAQIFFYLIEQRLHYGKIIHFYPECSRVNYDKNLRDFRRGAFVLSVKSKIPILPVRVVYREPKGIFKLYKKNPLMTLVFGKPIYPDPNAEFNTAVNELKEKAFKAMENITG
ncbi:MAG: glycosyltransferase, partial [Treponema sp.]|nr:glycosyltransferase [Treponema sp.]